MKITIGNLIDQLTIANIRIWMAEDIKRDSGATDKQLADATRITNFANQQTHRILPFLNLSLLMISYGDAALSF